MTHARSAAPTVRRASLATLLVTIALVALAAVAASHANAASYLYWTSADGNLGRVAVDGSNPDPEFVTGASEPAGPSVNAYGIYWANTGTNSIGHANLDGSEVRQGFITHVSEPTATAVNSSVLRFNEHDRVGTANFDGSPVADFSQLLTTGDRLGVAMDDMGVYWTVDGAIDSSGEPFLFLNNPAFHPAQLAIDSRFIYWTDPVSGTIGRARRDGSDPLGAFITGLSAPSGIVLDAGHIYWSARDGNEIGRANRDGSDPDPGYIGGIAAPTGLALSMSFVDSSATTVDLGSPALTTTSAAQSVTFTNGGASPMLPPTVQLTGADPGDFAITSDRCSTSTLAPGGGCAVTVAFALTALGDRSATLRLTSSDASQAPVEVALAGTGTPAPPGDAGSGDGGSTGGGTTGGDATATVNRTTCKTVTVVTGKGKARKRVKRTRCTVAVTVRSTGNAKATVSATLKTARSAVVARASGSARSGKLTLTLTANRKLAKGRYRLTVTTRSGPSHTVTRSLAVS